MTLVLDNQVRKIRKQSTGMGLYLVKQVDEQLNIQVESAEEYTEEFEIRFRFPIV